MHINVNLPVPFIPYEMEMPLDAQGNPAPEVPIDKELLKLSSRDFINWLNSLDIIIGDSGRIFNSPPHKQYKLHIDGLNLIGELTKLNFVFNSTDTIMKWYELLPGKTGKPFKNTLGIPVMYYDPNDCKILKSAPVNSNCLISGSIIHDLTNGSNNGQYRTCYSIALIKKSTGKRLTWNEAVEIFKPYLIVE
jgi:hypothetical protein